MTCSASTKRRGRTAELCSAGLHDADGRAKKVQISRIKPSMETITQLSGFSDTLLGYLLPFLFVLDHRGLLP